MILQRSLNKTSGNFHQSTRGKRAGNKARLPDLQYLEYLESRQLLTADLTGTFTAVPITAANGSSQVITMQVSNNGDTASRGPTVVDLFLQSSGSAAVGPRVRRLVLPALRAGQTRAVTFRAPVGAGVAAGDYQLVAKIDPTNRVAETDETNNTITSNVFTVRQRNFDLSVGFAQPQALIGPRLGNNTNGTAFVTLTNTGTDATPAGQRIGVQVFAQPVGASDASSKVLLNRLVVNTPFAIQPGATRLVAVPLQFPSTLPQGNFNLMASVNGNQTLAESDIANNTFTTTSPVFSTTSNLVGGLTTTPVLVNSSPTTGTTSPTAGNQSGQVIPTTPPGGLTLTPGQLGSFVPTSNLGTNLNNQILPTTSFSGVTPTTSLSTITPTTNLSTITPTTNLSTFPQTTTLNNVPIGLVGITPLNSLGSTPLNSLGNSSLNVVGITPVNSIGITPISSIGVTPTNSLGNLSFGSSSSLLI